MQEAHEVTVDAPGTEAAVEVTMWTTLPMEGGPRDVRWRWLIADLPDGRQVAVGAAGPRETFEELPLDEDDVEAHSLTIHARDVNVSR